MKKAGGPVMYRLITVSMLVLAIAIGGYTQTKRLATNSSSSPSYGKAQAERGKTVYSSTKRIVSNATEQLNSLGISQAYYTESQAERGKAYFYAACGVCHTADPKSQNGTMDTATGLGWHGGPVNSYGLFVGDAWLASASGVPGRPQRWDTVADLYNKVRTTQPAYDVAGLSTQEYLDIVAYLLKQNGLPSGKEELKNDLNQMRNMTLDKGFERLFNGKDFTGWGFVVGPNCKPAPEGCGGTTPGTTFKIKDGTVLNTGSPHGYMSRRRNSGILRCGCNIGLNHMKVWKATTTCSPTPDICSSSPNTMYGR